MSNLRKLQREVIRNKCYQRDHNIKSFGYEWMKYHNRRTEVKNNGIIESKVKKKKINNNKPSIRGLKKLKGFINNLKKQNDENITNIKE